MPGEAKRLGVAAGNGAPQGQDAVPRVGEESLAPALLKCAVERLEQVIDQETAALQTRAAVDLNDFNDRKSHGLVELTRAMRHFEAAPPDRSLLSSLASLRAKLEINRIALGMHLEAVREISTVVAQAMQSADSDGTYAPTIRNNAGTL